MGAVAEVISRGGATPSNPSHTAGWSRHSAAELVWSLQPEGAVLRARPSAKDAPFASGWVASLLVACGHRSRGLFRGCLEAGTYRDQRLFRGWDVQGSRARHDMREGKARGEHAQSAACRPRRDGRSCAQAGRARRWPRRAAALVVVPLAQHVQHQVGGDAVVCVRVGGGVLRGGRGR